MSVQHEYVGAGVGLNFEALGTNVVIAKKITVEHDSLLTSVAAYLKNPSTAPDDQVHNLAVAVYSDNAGAPGILLGGVSNAQLSFMLDAAPGDGGDEVARWYGVPVGLWLEAGDYHIAIQQHRFPAFMQIAYDDDGADPTYTAGGPWFADSGWYAATDSGKSYSIRASLIT